MINVKALNKLLTENTDGRLCVRWSIMTPNGALLAYTSPADMNDLRNQVALISMTWRENAEARRVRLSTTTSNPDDDLGNDQSKPPIRAMVMEFDSRNVLVHYLQAGLLLALEGGVPPGRSKQFKVTVEDVDGVKDTFDMPGSGARGINGYAQQGGNQAKVTQEPTSPSRASITSTTASTRHTRERVLNVHRRKLEAMASAIESQFGRDGFEMPSDPENRYF